MLEQGKSVRWKEQQRKHMMSSATPIPCTPAPLRAGGREFENEVEPRKKGNVYFKIRGFFSLL